MRRNLLLSLLPALLATSATAGTFETSRIAPDLGLDAFTRGEARARLDRDVFAGPYATVTLGFVDVYHVFPYVESRNFQVVADARWNRLVYGEAGRTLRAWDGAGGPLGPLAGPRGLAADEWNRIYVADAANDRIVVLQASTEHGDIELAPVRAIGGLHRPHAVAWSDGGTPFVAGDDVLYVADTGANRIVAFAVDDAGARPVAEIGELGSGPGRFAGPLAIAAGHRDGAGTRDVYVADAHSRRLVHLRHESGAFTWVGETAADADVVTSLDTDHWGNVYAAAPNRGTVRKYAPDLTPVAELRAGLERPVDFHVPFLTLRDHRTDRVERVGRPAGLSVDRWADATGVRLWNLGIEVSGLAAAEADGPAARFTLTDAAEVTVEVADAATGRALARRPAGTMAAGVHTLAVTEADLAAAAGAAEPVLRVSAASRYADGPTAAASMPLDAIPGGARAGRVALLGNSPNPVAGATLIAFALPDAAVSGASLQVYDAMGRLVRGFEPRFRPGVNEVLWDATDQRGRAVPAGVYFARLRAGGQERSHAMVVVW